MHGFPEGFLLEKLKADGKICQKILNWQGGFCGGHPSGDIGGALVK